MKNIISIMLAVLFCISVSGSEFGKHKKLKISKEIKLDVPEPSGLALSADGKYLWTVSDETKNVYLISLDGKIQKKFPVNSYDLEGISVISDTAIAVVAERTREIIFMNNDGKEYFRKKILNDAVDNSGLEGIAFNKNNNHIFIVKEKDPKLLIELDSKLNVVRKKEIDFLDDLSGLDFNPETNELWMISDESKTIARCSNEGVVKETYKVKIDQIEGIAVDRKSNLICLVSDKEEKLYILKIN